MLNARPVRGFWRRLRWQTDAALVVILFAIPWIEIGGEPLLRLDIPARQFHVFGLVIFPQELFFLWLIIAGLAVALFFFTALAGRLWCGWACPQTVFSDLFAAIARRIQGWTQRAPKHVAPWRKVATHAVWLVLSFGIGFHLVAYFRSPYVMLAELGEGTLSATTGTLLLVGGLASYLDFGIVRQVFCKFLCPYARFQGVLFDRETLVIGYDTKRGEPRGKRGSTTGDCVDCHLCVEVCPTEIDIRDGLQLECIACTQCIDACDGVMEKLGRDPGLISYRSLIGLEGTGKARLLRPRVMVYGALLLAATLGFAITLAQRVPLDLQVWHNRTAMFQKMPDGRIGNAYTLHVQNRDRQAHSYHLGLDAPSEFELIAGVNPIELAATTAAELRVFVVVQPDGQAHAARTRPIGFSLQRVDRADQKVERSATFVFPATGGASGD